MQSISIVELQGEGYQSFEKIAPILNLEYSQHDHNSFPAFRNVLIKN
jgi:hypothetical protein